MSASVSRAPLFSHADAHLAEQDRRADDDTGPEYDPAAEQVLQVEGLVHGAHLGALGRVEVQAGELVLHLDDGAGVPGPLKDLVDVLRGHIKKSLLIYVIILIIVPSFQGANSVMNHGAFECTVGTFPIRNGM